MAIGIFSYSYALSSLTSFIQALDKKEARLKEKLSLLEELRSEYPISYTSYIKIRKALKYAHNRNEVDKYDFLESLPQNLRIELSVTMHQDMINKIPFFQDRDSHFIAKICPLLRPVKVLKNDVIYKEGDLIEDSIR